MPDAQGFDQGRAPASGDADARLAVPETRRVMVVEDDAFTRTLLVETLQAHGFEVLECATSREALRGFDAFDPDLLVTDIQLDAPPNGVQLAFALHARAPYLGIVIVSQYPNPDAAMSGSPLPPSAAFVHKGRIQSASVILDAIASVVDDRVPPALLPADVAGGLQISNLSATQIENLRMIALGFSNERIARERDTTVRAVERLVHRTYARLGLDATDGSVRVLAARAYIEAFGLPADDA
ncbi:MAG: response regulator [Gaiellales bacterium]